MYPGWHLHSQFVMALLAGSTVYGGLLLSSASAASAIYYCPDRRGDQLISATPGPGCVPLAETKQEQRDESVQDKRRRDFHIENLKQDVSAFLARYRHFVECCKNDLGEWAHWGATTQDITDTATILQIRESLDLIEKDINGCADALAKLAKKHRDTVMVGRSNLQQAVPITFGYKMATILGAFERHRERCQLPGGAAQRDLFQQERQPFLGGQDYQLPGQRR
jgi:hypothetical protein